jgi:hypothetical protein
MKKKKKNREKQEWYMQAWSCTVEAAVKGFMTWLASLQ